MTCINEAQWVKRNFKMHKKMKVHIVKTSLNIQSTQKKYVKNLERRDASK